jgi:hypothetical protein
MKMLENHIAGLQSLVLLGAHSQQGSIRWYIEWYSKRYPSRRVLYRVSGVGVLVLAALLAFNMIPRSYGAFAALATGLCLFFAWGAAWRGYFLAKVQLEFLIQRWEAAVVVSRQMGNEADAIKFLLNRLDELMNNSCEVIVEETKIFFDRIKFPSYSIGPK